MMRFCCVLWLCCSAEVAALSRFCPERPLVVGVFLYGYIYSEDNRGIDADVLQLLSERTGCKLQLEVMPRARTWHDLQLGLIDMTSTAIRTEEREQHSWFIPYLQLKNHLILSAALPDEQRSIRGFVANTKLYFGAVRGFKHGAPLDLVLQQLDAQQRVLYYPDAPTLFHALRLGRVQAIFSQPPIYRYFLAKELDAGVFLLGDWAPELGSTAHHLVLQRNSFSASQAQAWQQLIQHLQAQGELRQIFQRYLPAEEARLMEFIGKP